MKALIFNLFIIITLCSCEPPADNRLTDNHFISNKTNKTIVYKLFVDDKEFIKEDSFTFVAKGLCDSLLMWKITCIKGNVSHRAVAINYKLSVIYDIEDTTSATCDIRTATSGSNRLFSKFFSDQVKYEFSNDINEKNMIVDFYLTINDSLLFLMKKDYSMLEEFKEYYKK